VGSQHQHISFRCNCRETVEVGPSEDDDHILKCPGCRREFGFVSTIRTVLSRAAVVAKGTAPPDPH